MKKTLTEAQLEQRRNAGKQKKTMSPEAIEQRQAASKKGAMAATGPRTEAGKLAVSRNAWKTGEHSYVERAKLWRSIGMGIMTRPCKSTCPKYPCSLVEEGSTQPGGDCLDMSAYLEAFNTLMDVLHTGEVEHAHGLMASQAAQAVMLLQNIWDQIKEHGPLVSRPMTNKAGEVVADSEGKPYMIHLRNPLLNDVPKLMHELGIGLPEMLATPKSLKDTKNGEDAAGALQELFGRMGRATQTAGGGPVRHHTIDVTPESKDI